MFCTLKAWHVEKLLIISRLQVPAMNVKKVRPNERTFLTDCMLRCSLAALFAVALVHEEVAHAQFLLPCLHGFRHVICRRLRIVARRECGV